VIAHCAPTCRLKVVVVGGGVSGLKAALELCAVGAKVGLSMRIGYAFVLLHICSRSIAAAELVT
jgi:glycerol-3-phosphate dehydrogenase